MSCDSVRRNFASIPEDKALPWAWRENLHLLQDVIAEDYVADLDPTVKPLYGRQEGAEIGHSPQKPGRPSHRCHTLCIARLSRHARRGMVTIYTATSGKARETYRAISAFLSKVASALQLSLEERRQRIIAYAFRKYGTIRRMFPPDIGGQMTMPLA